MHSERQGDTFTYTINSDDEIISVSSNWNTFSEENNGKVEQRFPSIIGKMLWDCFFGVEVNTLYKMLVAQVRKEKKSISVPIHCDSHDLVRHMVIEVKALPNDYVEFFSKVEQLIPRKSLAYKDISKPKSSKTISICSFCEKIKSSETVWLETEVAMQRMEVLRMDKTPLIIYSICSDCRSGFLKKHGLGNGVPDFLKAGI